MKNAGMHAHKHAGSRALTVRKQAPSLDASQSLVLRGREERLLELALDQRFVHVDADDDEAAVPVPVLRVPKALRLHVVVVQVLGRPPVRCRDGAKEGNPLHAQRKHLSTSISTHRRSGVSV